MSSAGFTVILNKSTHYKISLCKEVALNSRALCLSLPSARNIMVSLHLALLLTLCNCETSWILLESWELWQPPEAAPQGTGPLSSRVQGYASALQACDPPLGPGRNYSFPPNLLRPGASSRFQVEQISDQSHPLRQRIDSGKVSPEATRRPGPCYLLCLSGWGVAGRSVGTGLCIIAPLLSIGMSHCSYLEGTLGNSLHLSSRQEKPMIKNGLNCMHSWLISWPHLGDRLVGT